MNLAIQQMLKRHPQGTRDDAVNALREILQQVALLGLWRAKFFEHAAFYGGTALRILHGLDRYSEDLDFSLLAPDSAFSLAGYGDALIRELNSFGFDAAFAPRGRNPRSGIESAFLKANTLRQLLVIRPGSTVIGPLHPDAVLKVKLEVDTDPPGGFRTESRIVLLPTPFAVRVYSLPDLLAGKLHAILCRRWKTRSKGRDWYDLVWYAGHHPAVRLSHLEARLRHSGDWSGPAPFTLAALRARLDKTIAELDAGQVRTEADRYVADKTSLALWSRDFFRQVSERITVAEERRTVRQHTENAEWQRRSPRTAD